MISTQARPFLLILKIPIEQVPKVAEVEVLEVGPKVEVELKVEKDCSEAVEFQGFSAAASSFWTRPPKFPVFSSLFHEA